MRIGILTGGGDVPGLNPCIKAVTRRAVELGWEVIGFRRGWAGPLNYNLNDPEASAEEWLMPLDLGAVRTIDRTGGTILHTSRTDPDRVPEADLPAFLADRFPIAEGATSVDCTPHILDVIEHLKLDVMVAIGGDGTLSYAARLHRDGVRIMSIPKTMDNDVFGTDYCIGFSTAVTRSVEAINALRSTAGSHERIAVVELFGRNSGETALISGFLADADRAVIAEVPFDPPRLAELLAGDRRDNPSNYAVVVVSEGARSERGNVSEYGEADVFGRRKLGGIGQAIGKLVHQETGIDVITQSVAYLMRSGPPDSLDRMVAASYGTMAVQLLADGETGKMMALRDGNYTAVPSDMPLNGEKRVEVAALYDVDAYRPRIAQVLDKPMFLY